LRDPISLHDAFSYRSIRETVFTLLFGLLHFIVDVLALNYDKLK